MHKLKKIKNKLKNKKITQNSSCSSLSLSFSICNSLYRIHLDFRKRISSVGL